jgi:hypothetical protein
LPGSINPSAERPPVWRTAARACGISCSIESGFLRIGGESRRRHRLAGARPDQAVVLAALRHLVGRPRGIERLAHLEGLALVGDGGRGQYGNRCQ